MLKSSVVLFCFILDFWACLWENPQPPRFYDFGTSGRVPGSRHHLSLSFETQGYFKYSKKTSNSFLKHVICIHLDIFEIHDVLKIVEKASTDKS